MKLVTYSLCGVERLGFLVGDQVLDAEAGYRQAGEQSGGKLGYLPNNILDFLRLGEQAFADAQKLCSFAVNNTGAFSAPALHKADDVTLLTLAQQVPMSLIHHAGVQQDFLCRVLGECRFGPPIDGELGDLVGGAGLLRDPLFSYVRYEAESDPRSLDDHERIEQRLDGEKILASVWEYWYSRLSPDDQFIMEARWKKQPPHSYLEIAAALGGGWEEATVRQRHRRVLQRTRRYLEEQHLLGDELAL